MKPYTTSSATEWTRPAVLIIRCPDCGFMRRASTHPHAPRWQGGRQVDCAGREVKP